MTLMRYKKIIIAVLLMAFTGQSLAALAMSCQVTGKTLLSAAQIMMPSMNHSQMVMDHLANISNDHQHSSNDKQAASCCKLMGQSCSQGNCSLMSVMSTFVLFVEAVISVAVDSYTSVQPLPLVSLPYRPPIFR